MAAPGPPAPLESFVKSFLKTVAIVLVVLVVALLLISLFAGDQPLDFNYGGFG